MKHIKSFNESTQDLSLIKREIDDTCLELQDLGYTVTAQYKNRPCPKMDRCVKLYEEMNNDLKYSARDVTNKYCCAKGWIRYTSYHIDSYIDIERYFGITWDHLGWILEDFVESCDLVYHCSVRDTSGRYLSHEDSDGNPDSITIEFTPENFIRVGGHNGVNFKKHIKDFSIQLLVDIEEKLEENFPYLTIINDGHTQGNVGNYNLFITNSQITLKIKRKE